MKSLSRNKIFELLGTVPTNPRWSWCALSPDHKRAVFTLWEDEIENRRNILLGDDYSTKAKHGLVDQKRILEICLKENIPSYGLICVAVDPSAVPRTIKSVKSDLLVRLRLERVGNVIWGNHLEVIHSLELAKTIRSDKASKENALTDIGDVPEGQASPDRALAISYSVVRDPTVRRYVISTANGRCEYCQQEGFLTPNGNKYLESHHIIALAKHGKDTVDNVIALCPEHHREAHFGANADGLEQDFIDRVNKRNEIHNKPLQRDAAARRS